MASNPRGGDSTRRFAADGLLMIGANGTAALLYLLVHVALGRRLPGVDYAVLVSLLGLLNILGIGAAALQTTLARYIALAAQDDGDDGGLWLAVTRRALRRAGLWALPAAGLWCLATPWLRDALGAPSAWALVLLGATAALQLFQPLVQGSLQGLRRFGALAGSSMAGAATRLLAAVTVVYLGGGVTAALWAFVLGALVALAVACWPLRNALRGAESPGTPDFDSGPIYRYLGLALVGQAALYGLMNADLVLAPRLLQGETLAAYSKAAMLARTVVFLPLPLVIAMFPRAVVSGRRRILAGTMAAAAALAAVPATLVALWPGVFLAWMYGAVEPQAPALLRQYVWAMLPLLLVEVAVPYLWARRQPWAVVALVLPMLLYASALTRLPDRPEAMIQGVAAAGTLFLLWLLAAAWRGRRGAPDLLSSQQFLR
ncbi:MAG: hypothetical protein AAGN66_17425 [Acidobacteriota bacterium]